MKHQKDQTCLSPESIKFGESLPFSGVALVLGHELVNKLDVHAIRIENDVQLSDKVVQRRDDWCLDARFVFQKRAFAVRADAGILHLLALLLLPGLPSYNSAKGNRTYELIYREKIVPRLT